MTCGEDWNHTVTLSQRRLHDRSEARQLLQPTRVPQSAWTVADGALRCIRQRIQLLQPAHGPRSRSSPRPDVACRLCLIIEIYESRLYRLPPSKPCGPGLSSPTSSSCQFIETITLNKTGILPSVRVLGNGEPLALGWTHVFHATSPGAFAAACTATAEPPMLPNLRARAGSHAPGPKGVPALGLSRQIASAGTAATPSPRAVPDTQVLPVHPITRSVSAASRTAGRRIRCCHSRDKRKLWPAVVGPLSTRH